jgi:hypothetical protein
MKCTSFLVVLACALSICSGLRADTIEVLETGPDDRRVQVVHEEIDASGVSMLVTNAYTEVATGLNYWDGQSYQPSVPEFLIIGDEAVAEQGQSKLILPSNLNVAGAVYLLDADGKEYRSTPGFLAMRSPSTQQAAVIGMLKDTAGGLVASDQVLYRDAFEGVAAAVRYLYRLDGIEQDVVIYEPLDPQ